MSVEAPAMSGPTIVSTSASFAEGASSAASLSIASASEGLSQASVAGLGFESMAIGVESVGISTAVGEVGSNIAIQTEVAALEASDVAALAQTRDALDAIINGISVPQGVESAVSNAPIETENQAENAESVGFENTIEGEAGQNGDSADNTTVQQDQEKREDADEVAQEDSENTTEDADSDSQSDVSEQDEETTEEDSTNKEETENESEDNEDGQEEETNNDKDDNDQEEEIEDKDEEVKDEEEEKKDEDKKDPEKPVVIPVIALDKLDKRLEQISSSVSRRSQRGQVFAADVADDFMRVASQDSSLQSNLQGIPANTGEPNQTASSYGQDKTIRTIGTEIAKIGFGGPQEIFNAAVHAAQKFVPVDMAAQGSGPQASEEQVAQVTGGTGVAGRSLRRAA